MAFFFNRADAGTRLSQQLLSYRVKKPIVLGLARGGVPVAYPIARALRAPLECRVIRKIGAPLNPEYGIGAVAEDGTYYIDVKAASRLNLSPDDIENRLSEEREEAIRRMARYQMCGPQANLRGRCVIIVDEGLATGVSARAACESLHGQGVSEIVLAVPVCSEEGAQIVRPVVDVLVALSIPRDFHSVSEFYERFEELSDNDIRELLDQGGGERPTRLFEREVA